MELIKNKGNNCGWSRFQTDTSDTFPSVKVSIIPSILQSGPICSLGYFLSQPVVCNWSIKPVVCAVCPVCGKVHIKDSLLLIRKSSLCGDNAFSLKKYVSMTIYLMYNSG